MQDRANSRAKRFLRHICYRFKVDSDISVHGVLHVHGLIAEQRNSYQGYSKVDRFLCAHESSVRDERLDVLVLYSVQERMVSFFIPAIVSFNSIGSLKFQRQRKAQVTVSAGYNYVYK